MEVGAQQARNLDTRAAAAAAIDEQAPPVAGPANAGSYEV